MKVINKFFVIALLLSLILTMGAVAAKDNMTFEQSNTNMVSIETNNHVVEEKSSPHDIYYVLAAANPNAEDDYPNFNILLDTQSEGVVELDGNQQYSTESYSHNTEIINEE